jgi:hypothetical protein
MRAMTFLKAHPFWTLFIVAVVFAVLSYLLFVPGHGSGGMELGPITPDH